MKRSSIFFLIISLLCAAVVNGSTGHDDGDIDAACESQSVVQSHFRLSNTVIAIFPDTVIDTAPGAVVKMDFPGSGVIPDLIEGPNDDIRRERIFYARLLTSCVFVDPIFDFNESLIPIDATPLQSHASYSYSSTAFHSFLFRLTPF